MGSVPHVDVVTKDYIIGMCSGSVVACVITGYTPELTAVKEYVVYSQAVKDFTQVVRLEHGAVSFDRKLVGRYVQVTPYNYHHEPMTEWVLDGDSNKINIPLIRTTS
jgi:hypothetical protein